MNKGPPLTDLNTVPHIDLHEIPKKFQYITVDSNFVNGSNNTFSLDLTLESNTHVEDMSRVLGIRMVDFYITQVGAQAGTGTPFTATTKIEGESDYGEGFVKMSLDGKRIIVGGPDADDNGSNSGRVKIYEKTSSGWTQVGNTITGATNGDKAGWGVAINDVGSRVAVGSYNAHAGGTRNGLINMYEYNISTGNWDQMGSTINGEFGSLFGISMDMNAVGDIVCAGAYSYDLSNNNRGLIRAYEWDGSAWSQKGGDMVGAAGNSEQLGWSVSISGDGERIAGGAYQYNISGGSDAGAMRIYAWDGSNYTQMGGSPLLGDAADEEAGYSVSISTDGTTAAMGFPEATLGGGLNKAGRVRVFKYNTTSSTWEQRGADILGENTKDKLGHSVALSGNGSRIAVGAIQDVNSLLKRGYVKMLDYKTISNTWTLVNDAYYGETGDQLGRTMSMDLTGDMVVAGSIQNGGFVQIFEPEPASSVSNVPKYVDVVCPDIPKSSQILDERNGQILARIPLERHFTETSTTILRDKQWRRFQQKTNYFNPISIKKLNFSIYEEQDDGDYVKLKPDSKWYMILEIATVNVKEKPRDKDQQMLQLLQSLLVKMDALNQNVRRLPDIPPEEPKKKYPFGLLLCILVTIFGGFIWSVNRSTPSPQIIQ